MAPWHGQDHRRGCLPPGNSSNWYASLSGRPSSEKRSVVPESFSRHQDRKSSYYAPRASSRPPSSSQRPFNGPPASRQMTPSLDKGHRRDSLPLGHLSHRHAQGTPSNPLGCPSFFSARSISSSGGQMGGLEERMQPEQSREPSDRARLDTGSRKRAYDESFSGRSTSSEGRHYARNLEEEAAQTRRRRYLHHQRDDTPTASDPLPCSDLRHALHRRHGSQEKVQETQHQEVTISLQQSFTGLPSAASASADDRLQTLLQLWVRKAQHSRCCPFSSGGLAELKQIDACKYKQIAFSWSLPLDPSDPSAKPLCKFNKTKKKQTRSLFLSALQDHADHAGGVDNEDVVDDDDDVRRAASCAHHFLAEILRTLTNKVAPAMRQAVPEQPFHEKIPWPPLLLVTRLPAGIEPPTAALATLLGGHKPSAQVRVPSGSLANTVVLLFGGDDECEAYESAKQLLARSSQPSESGAVRWLEEADLRTFEAEGSAQQLLTDLSTHKAERGGAVRVEWVLKAATERRLFDEKLRRRLEAERKHAQLEEEKNKLMLELDALRRNSKALEDAQYLAISQTKSLIQMKGREERKLLEDRYRNELEILELEKDKAITEVAKEQKKAAHLKRQLEKLQKCSASADRLERKAGELHEVRKAKMRLEKRVFDTKEAVKQLRKEASEAKQGYCEDILPLHFELCDLEAKLDELLVDVAVKAKVAGQIDWKELKKLGFKCESKPLSLGAKRAGPRRASPGGDALLRQEVRVLQSRFWASLHSVGEADFHPKRAFKQAADGVWDAIREHDEEERVGTHTIMVKASWVKKVRTKYKKKANGILQYLLKMFNEFCAHPWSRTVNGDMPPKAKLEQLA